MKLRHLIPTLILVCSCSSPKSFVVEGTISNHDGENVEMVNLSTNEKQTATIEKGKFTFKTDPSDTTLVLVRLVSQRRNINFCHLVAEAGKNYVNLDNQDTYNPGGPLNRTLSLVLAESNELLAKYNTLFQQAEDEIVMDQISRDYVDAFIEFTSDKLKENPDNAVGVYLARTACYYFESLAEFDAYLEGTGNIVRNDVLVKMVHDNLYAKEYTREGCQFVDFNGQDKNGNPVALSDYVGKGKWVLVDFWASWCGPCRAEIPNIIAAYKRYGNKITVLGVPVWDERSATDKALAEMNIPYDQIFVGDDTSSTERYGIQGIPQIILFAPDGMIYRRDLRGPEIDATLRKVL